MLYKPLVSLVVAFATASSVAASIAPVRRGGYGTYPPPPRLPTIPRSQCNTESVQCCDTFTSPSNPVAAFLLNSLDIVAGPNVGIGLNCGFFKGNQW
jgi:Fungal hydrophobin